MDCAVVLPGSASMTMNSILCEHFLVLDLVWIAFGSQYALHLFEVNVERGIMVDLEITVGVVSTT